MSDKNEFDIERENIKKKFDSEVASIVSRQKVSDRYSSWKEKNKQALEELAEIRNSCRHTNVTREGPTAEEHGMCDSRVTKSAVRCRDCGHYFVKEWQYTALS